MSIKLPKVIVKKQKRVGRGYGSGRGGHTSGRGQKGQKARGSMGILFEGMKMKKSLVKRLPLKRGKGKFNARSKSLVVNLEYLNILPAGTEVNIKTLVGAGIIDRKAAQDLGVKILGDGEINKKLTIALPISKSAAKKIEKAGGKIKN